MFFNLDISLTIIEVYLKFALNYCSSQRPVMSKDSKDLNK